MEYYNYYNIEILGDKILDKLKSLNPASCWEWDDPQINTFYISLTPNYLLMLHGICDDCELVALYYDKTDKDIMTDDKIDHFVNMGEEEIFFNHFKTELFELELNEFTCKMDELVSQLIAKIKEFVPL